MNTNFNTQITINPENLSMEEFEEFEQLKEQLRPLLEIFLKLMMMELKLIFKEDSFQLMIQMSSKGMTVQ